MNLPNALTAMRLLLIPILGYYLNQRDYSIAAVVFIIGGLTDILDGHIARKYNLVTSFGKAADPVADKLMQITALVFLTMQDKIPYMIMVIVIAKEVFMIAGGIFLYKKDKAVVAANWYGKLATVVFYLAIVMSMFNAPYSNTVVTVAVLVTIYAFIMYFFSFRKIRSTSVNK